MKKLCLMFAVVLTVLLAACGEMSQQDVVDKLTSNLEDAKSYYATGVMEVDNNGQVYQYNVEVAYREAGNVPEGYKVTYTVNDVFVADLSLKINTLSLFISLISTSISFILIS